MGIRREAGDGRMKGEKTVNQSGSRVVECNSIQFICENFDMTDSDYTVEALPPATLHPWSS